MAEQTKGPATKPASAAVTEPQPAVKTSPAPEPVAAKAATDDSKTRQGQADSGQEVPAELRDGATETAVLTPAAAGAEPMETVTNVSTHPLHIDIFFLVPTVPTPIFAKLLTENSTVKNWLERKMLVKGAVKVEPEVEQPKE